MCNRATKNVRLHVVGEASSPVDLDDRKPLAMRRFECCIAGNVDLYQVEVEVVTERAYLRERAFAQMTTVRVVDDDADQR